MALMFESSIPPKESSAVPIGFDAHCLRYLVDRLNRDLGDPAAISALLVLSKGPILMGTHFARSLHRNEPLTLYANSYE